MRERPLNDADLGTVPAVAKAENLNPRVLRQAIRRGEIPSYHCGTAWPRVRRSEVRSWIASTRIAPTPHAAARLAEVLEREGRAGSP